MIYTTSYSSPLGMLTLHSDGTALTALQFQVPEAPGSSCMLLEKTVQQLREYFSGMRTQFTLPLAPAGTDFQQEVWQALCRIPYGETRTYKDIAIAIGHPKAFRAVGRANNANPVFIAIPCHRVIGADGSLVGYGGGLEMKKALLELERGRKQ